MLFKRVILLVALLGLIAHATVRAQERGPLFMRVEFEFTIFGLLGGAAVGALIWLTDPADPSNNLSDTVAAGSAFGAIIGAGIGIFILQRTAIAPSGFAQIRDPLHPSNRISSDPVGDRSGKKKLLASAIAPGRAGRGLTLPLLNLRF